MPICRRLDAKEALSPAPLALPSDQGAYPYCYAATFPLQRLGEAGLTEPRRIAGRGGPH